MFDTISRDNPGRKLCVAAYGRIASDGNVMRSGYAELVSHFSTIIHDMDGWEYTGVYVDRGFGQTDLERLMADGRAGKIDLVIVPNVSVLRKEALLEEGPDGLRCKGHSGAAFEGDRFVRPRGKGAGRH